MPKLLGEASIDRNPDGHLHAFVFIDHADAKIASILDEVALTYRRTEFPRVRWAGTAIGDYLAFAHVEVDDQNDLDGLQTFIQDDLWDKGVHCVWSSEIAVINRKGTKKDTPQIISLVGIKTRHGKTRSVAQQLANIDITREGGWFTGASIVNGPLDIILQLNADSLLEAQDQLFLDPEFAGLLGGVKGIAWTSTAIADGTRGPWAEPLDGMDPPAKGKRSK